MLTCTVRTLSALLLLAASAVLFAATDQKTEQKIDQLMLVSGLKHAIERFPLEIEAQIKQQQISNPDDALSNEESKLLFSHFKPDIIYDSLKQHLSNKLDPQSLNTLLAMHDAPLMKRIIIAETAASSSKTEKEMGTYIDTLRHTPPPAARIKLIQQLDRAAMSTESVLHIMQMMILGMNEMMAGRHDENSPAQRAQQQKMIANASHLIEGELRQQIIMSMHYIYRDFTDEELKNHITQLKRDESQYFTRTAIEGIGIVILDAFKHGMKQLLQLRNARAV